MGARRKARELAVQMLYQFDLSGNAPDMIIDTFEDLQKSKPNTREFAAKSSVAPSITSPISTA